MMFRFLTALTFCCLAGAAAAEPVSLTSPSKGTIYFNQPGADLAAHRRDVEACMLKAEEGIYGPPITLSGGIVPGLIGGGQQNFIRRTNIENCMVVRGWRVIRVSGAAESELAGLAPVPLAEQLANLVGAETPNGQIVRQWGNDAASPDSKKGGMPGVLAGLNLSIKATPIDGDLMARLAAPKTPPTPTKWQEAVVTKSTPLDQLGSRSPGKAIVVVTIKGRKKSNDTRMVFGRQEFDRAIVPTVKDGPTAIFLMLGRGVRSPETDGGEIFVMVVPPGRWVLGSAGELLNFCMGAPAFEAKAGEVVFAGAFDFDKPGLGPDLSLTNARAYLSKATPEAAEALRPAAWVNGETSACDGAGMYALEFPEFPYREGYVKAGSFGPR